LKLDGAVAHDRVELVPDAPNERLKLRRRRAATGRRRVPDAPNERLKLHCMDLVDRDQPGSRCTQ